MKSRLVRLASGVVVALCVFGPAAWAQRSLVDVPFEFTVSGEKLPAGHYSVQPYASGNGLVMVNLDEKRTVNVVALTRLSPKRDGSAELIFDNSGEKKFLSEVYLPGMNGFHLRGAPGKHSHTRVAGKQAETATSKRNAQTLPVSAGLR